MKRKFMCMLFVSAFVVAWSSGTACAAASRSVSVGVTVGNDGVGGFHLAVCEHYKAKQETVAVFRVRKIPDDHIPIVFFMAERAHCAPEAIVELRLGGMAWADIALRYKLQPDVFYVEVSGDHGPPYGRALGYYKGRPRNAWNSIRLADDDVACLVNLQFLSTYHHCSVDDVVKLHVGGENLFALHGKLKARGAQGKADTKASAPATDKKPAAAVEKPQERGKPESAGAGSQKPTGNFETRSAGSGKGKGGGGSSGGDSGKRGGGHGGGRR